MDEIGCQEEINIDEVIRRLNELVGDRESFFTEDGEDGIYREDYRRLLQAIKLLEELKVLKVASILPLH